MPAVLDGKWVFDKGLSGTAGQAVAGVENELTKKRTSSTRAATQKDKIGGQSGRSSKFTPPHHRSNGPSERATHMDQDQAIEIMHRHGLQSQPVQIADGKG